MATTNPDWRKLPRKRWGKVTQAKDLLNKRAHDIAQALIDQALAGDAKSARWLLEHTADTDDSGAEIRPIAPSIDRQIQPTQAGDSSPRILIGVSLGSDFARLNTQAPARALESSTVSQVVTTPSETPANSPIIDVSPVLASQAHTPKP